MGVIASLFNFGKQTQIKEQINYNGIQENELIEFLNNFKNQISVNNEKLQASIEKSIEKILISKVKLIIAEIYKEHCESCSPDEKLVLSLDQIKSKADNMTSDIQKVITDLQDTKNAAKEIRSKLNESREQVEAEIKSLSRICEDILYWSHRTHALCEKLFEKITITENDQEKLTTLFTQYINAAELRHKELLVAIEKSSETNQSNNDNTFSYLDMSTIAAMFAVINEINKKQKAVEDISDLIEQSVNEVYDCCKQIQRDIIEICDGTVKGIAKANEIIELQRRHYELSKDTNKTVHVLEEKIDRITQLKLNRQDLADDIHQLKLERQDNNLSKAQLTKINNTLITKQTQLDSTIAELRKLQSKGAKSLSPCPYCGTKENNRYVINDGHCECSVCGHRYIDINPDMSGISDERIKHDLQKWLSENQDKLGGKCNDDKTKGNKWKKLHTAKLERVSQNLRQDLYRIKLDKYTVSSNGLLIIPNKTHDDNPITEIAFCQPNTYDEASKERFNEVKTIILSDNVELSTYEGNYPFENIKVLRWNADQQIDLTSESTGEVS